MRVGASPKVHLIHVLAEEATWQGSSTTFAHQPIPIRRPAHGRVAASLECATCGLSINLRIGSRRSTAWRRRAWLSTAVLSWIASASPLLAWQLMPEFMNSLSSDQTLWWIGGSIMVFFIGTFAFIWFFIEDGVSLSEDGRRWTAWRRERHGLQRF